MNKLVIVGNGFDLAHGLPTSYKHFIDDFWKNLKNKYQEKNISQLIYFNESYERIFEHEVIGNFDDFIDNIQAYSNVYAGFYFNSDKYSLTATEQNTTFQNVPIEVFKFRNSFFKNINVKNSIENWVDIENEYYQKLKEISKQAPYKSSNEKTNTKKQQEQINKEDIRRLNEEFEQIKKLFEVYMISQVKSKLEYLLPPQISNSFFDFFDMTFVVDHTEKGKRQFNKYLSEFLKKHHPEILNYQNNFKLYETDIGEGKRALEDISKIISQVTFLNFNYTDTASLYCQALNQLYYCNSKEIKIHGQLENRHNEINFGYGDEMDNDYELIENLNDNEYLKNFKSFKYSQNSNYKNLLDFVDSQKFQVFIMGHSCGLSDRTLLNTIFEHENCLSIKVFYHKKQDGSDNFTEIVQNISRHFNNKSIMREKIVNKGLCIPLPQDKNLPEVY
jgi:hypothetical protein